MKYSERSSRKVRTKWKLPRGPFNIALELFDDIFEANKEPSKIFNIAKSNYRDASKAIDRSAGTDAPGLRASLRHYAVADAFLQRRLQRTRITAIIPAVVYYALLVVGGIKVDSGFRPEVTAVSLVIAVALALGCIYPAVYFVDKVVRAMAAMLVTALVVYGIAVAVEGAQNNFWNAVPASPNLTARGIVANELILVSLGIADFMLVGTAFAVVMTVWWTHWKRLYSNVVIVRSLLRVLDLMDKRKSSFGDLATKRSMCRELEIAAEFMQGGVLRSLALPDALVRRTLEQKLTSSAEYLRELQVRIVLAKEGADSDLRESLVVYAQLVLRGLYDSLPAGNIEVPLPGSASKIAAFGRAFLVAVIPFACLVSTRYIGLKLSDDFTGWAVVVTLAWAAITLVSSIDPLYKARLGDVRDLISAIRGKEG